VPITPRCTVTVLVSPRPRTSTISESIIRNSEVLADTGTAVSVMYWSVAEIAAASVVVQAI
jgi:hypothetical protein